jgi:subtilisin family serine protease
MTMAARAIVTPRGGRAINPAAVAMDTDGVDVSQTLASGTLVEGERAQLLALEDQGLRVKLLADTNLLRIGEHVIDTAAAVGADAAAALPAQDSATWCHHLVQCAAPPSEDWIRELEGHGVDVVEPISAYGLFVVGDPADVAALTALPFVTWTGPFLPAYRIDGSAEGLAGDVPLTIAVYPAGEAASVEALLSEAGCEPALSEAPAPFGGTFAVLKAVVPATMIPGLAAHPSTRWIEHRPRFEAFGEREAQIVAENLDAGAPPNTAPVTGYEPWLTGLGVSGSGTTVAIVDTGVDANAANNASGHTDLRGRQTAFVDYTGGADPTDTDGHGTHVAGIAIGNAATGQVESPAPGNFLWGQGMAPQASFVTQNFLPAVPQPGTTTLVQDSAANGADVMNNSWGFNNSPGAGYTAESRTLDRAVRDANGAGAGIRNLVIVCAAGNDGGSDRSISRPHETKNDIVVGNSLTSRPNNGFPGDDIRGIAGSSSRGPAVDGRILPTVVAPGTDVSAALSRTSARAPIPGTGVADPLNPGTLIDQYLSLTGTSMATPAVSGACALVIDWWRQTRSGQDPSPALVKALLVNTAEDLAGGQNWRALNRTSVDKALWSLHAGSVFRRTLTYTPDTVLSGSTTLTQVGSIAAITAAGQWFFDVPTSRLFVRTPAGTSPGAANATTVTARDSAPLPHIPNGHQGWGRVSLENILLQAPASDRGPRIVSDESHAFTANGQEHMIRVAPVDPGRPLRITVAWTDAAAAVGSNPALVNDLDLEVTEVDTGNVFKGNVFVNGFSATGGSFDDRNNVECVYIEHPAGVYEVRVIAASITASARPDIVTSWQDFALVVDNADVPDTGPVSVVPVIDRSGSMAAYGYVGTTRTASKQFVGLLGIDDELGVVSFGNDGTVEFPAGPPALHTVTGQPVAGANAAIDAIGFGGCTFMGDGIVKGRDLLAGASNPRGLVLFSDGYDNRGCDALNPAKQSAQAAAATLPPPVALHTCAMGPASDQALLAGLARNGGRYFYMPTIDDLFEIYNYIRGQVSGDAISVIASAQASTSQVPVMVDALAETATITVAWADPTFRFVAGKARKEGQVDIRLRDPSGRLLHTSASQVHRVVGNGYVVFKLHDPAPGLWHVRVSTVSKRHLRYTVGGFCDSPLRLDVKISPRLAAGKPLAISAAVRSGKTPVGARMTATVLVPSVSLAGVLRANRDALAQHKPPRDLDGDGLPPSIARMATLRRVLAKAGKPDPFATKSSSVALRRAATNGSAALSGQFAGTAVKGTYNVVVRASGVDPASGARYTRQQLVSVLVS